jgi:hypothetical protein
MRGGGRLRAGVVAGRCRDASEGFGEDFVEAFPDFEEAYPVSFVFGFFLLVPGEVGMFLLGLKTAQA